MAGHVPESVSHYRIIEKLGAGGMGAVFKARDTRLDRVVALKILSHDLVPDPIRKRRFMAEAKAASALNHPNIVTIYDTGSDADTDFIAMEYVAGRTLEQCAAHKPLPIDEAIAYAIQIAGALAAAHRAGIIHRDLKPGNIMVAAGERIKLVDFGLAKLIEQHVDSTPAESTPTRTLAEVQPRLTEEGHIVGTIAYMSPEQLTGGAMDARTDVFAFGTVLYEMLTGIRPFRGSNSIETAAQILKLEPEAAGKLVEGIPPALDRIVWHCLRKDPEKRFQSIADVARLLEDLRTDVPGGGQLESRPASVLPRRRATLLAGAGMVLLAIAGYAGLRLIRSAPPGAGPVYTRLTFDSGLTTDPTLSADGKLLAYASDRGGGGNLDIWVRQLAGGEAIQVTRDPADESEPGFSPDGTKIVYHSNRDGGGIYITSTLGGAEPQMLAAGGHSPRFSPDGKWMTYYSGEMAGLSRRPMRMSRCTGNVDFGIVRRFTALES
jgi:tRNA A-37 threonylcarbamoyl transferase component Bud32